MAKNLLIGCLIFCLFICTNLTKIGHVRHWNTSESKTTSEL